MTELGVSGALQQCHCNQYYYGRHPRLSCVCTNKFLGCLRLVQVLADGLRTGVTEWLEPLEAKSAVDLVQEFLNGVCFPDSLLSQNLYIAICTYEWSLA